jgi:hypothetical protein
MLIESSLYEMVVINTKTGPGEELLLRCLDAFRAALEKER